MISIFDEVSVYVSPATSISETWILTYPASSSSAAALVALTNVV